jgi:cytidylate kinase
LQRGDDEAARKTVLELAKAMGFDAVDCGPLKNVRSLEPLAFLNIQLSWMLGNGPNIGFKFVHSNCSKEVVRNREERTDPLNYRLFKAFLRGSYEGSLNAHKLNLVDSETILKITQRVVEHAAEKGNSVIVGRGSQHFLRERPDVLRIFLYADRDSKVARLMARGQSQAEAEELVDSVDLGRADYIRKYFGVEWPARTIHHALINMSIGDEAVVRVIVEFMKMIGPTGSTGEPL